MTPIDRAKADVTRLERDLARAQFQVQTLQSQILRVQTYIEMAEVYENEDRPASQPTNRGMGIAATSVRICIDAIRSRGERIHTRDLLKILHEQGVIIGGINPIGNL